MSADKREQPARSRVWLFASLFLLVAILLAACADQPEPLASAAQLQLGEQVYAQTCAVCHGDRGQGHVLPAAPALDDSEHAWHHPDAQIQQLIVLGGPTMPALGGQLNHEEVVAVIRYIQTWWTPEQLQAQQEFSHQYPLREP